jgi:hypothetical protein
MRRISLHVLCVFVLCQCEYSQSIDRNSQDWNANGIWKPLLGATMDFIPHDFAASQLAQTPGRWIVDPQDHCRFFIPNQGTASHRADVLQGEAWKATNRHSRANQRVHNTLVTAAIPLHIATLGIWAKHSRWNRSGQTEPDVNTSDTSDDLFRNQLPPSAPKSEPTQNETHSPSSSRSVTEALHDAQETKSKVDSDDLRKDFPVGKNN